MEECVYTSRSLSISILLMTLWTEGLRVIWTQIRPSRLPRGITSIVIGVVYHPPNAADPPMLDYLYHCLSLIQARHPGCGIILLGDFNKTLFKKSSRLSNSFDLKQIVTFPTPGRNTLDPVFTNLKELHSDPAPCFRFILSFLFGSPATRAFSTAKNKSHCEIERLTAYKAYGYAHISRRNRR